jgi:hypothetical protein
MGLGKNRVKFNSSDNSLVGAERRRQQGPARGPRMWMRIFWEPILSTTGDRIVGKRQTGARAEILGDRHRRIWEQLDESLEAFEKRVEAEAEALRQTAR